jgi:hypothetical protein
MGTLKNPGVISQARKKGGEIEFSEDYRLTKCSKWEC